LTGVAVMPARHVELVILLRPQHSGERLTLYETRIGIVDVVLEY
jgi:hypothetical protein